MPRISNHLYRFDDFELQPSRRVLLRGNQRLAVAPKTFEVLLCLVRNPGRVVMKEEIFQTVWPDSFVEEGNLTQHISWLRKVLTDKAEYIQTITGRGYEFTGRVEILPESFGAGPAHGGGSTVLWRATTTRWCWRILTMSRRTRTSTGR